MYLGLASLGQVYDIDCVVVQVLHTTVKVLPQKCAGFARQRDSSETKLHRRSKQG